MQPVIDVHYDSKNMLHNFVFTYFEIYIPINQVSMVDYGL